MFFLLFCPKVYAAPLSREELKAKEARGETITYEEKMAILEEYYPGKTEIAFGEDCVELDRDERKLYLKKIPGSYLDPETKAVIDSDSFELTNSYMSVVDDVIMIENNSSSNCVSRDQFP